MPELKLQGDFWICLYLYLLRIENLWNNSQKSALDQYTNLKL